VGLLVVNGALEAAGGLPVTAVIAVAVALLAVESGSPTGLAVPGTTILFALGIWTRASPGLPPITAASVAAATVAGTHINWWRGRHSGRAGGGRRRRFRVVSERGATLLAHWPAPSSTTTTALLLAVGHWNSLARPTLPRWAGAIGVPYRVAGPVFTMSGAAWAITVLLLAHHLGAGALLVAGTAPLLVFLLVIGTLIVFLRIRRAHRAHG
jgi:membrane-associated protein